MVPFRFVDSGEGAANPVPSRYIFPMVSTRTAPKFRHWILWPGITISIASSYVRRPSWESLPNTPPRPFVEILVPEKLCRAVMICDCCRRPKSANDFDEEGFGICDECLRPDAAIFDPDNGTRKS